MYQEDTWIRQNADVMNPNFEEVIRITGNDDYGKSWMTLYLYLRFIWQF